MAENTKTDNTGAKVDESDLFIPEMQIDPKKEKFNQWLYRGVLMILIVIFVVGVVYGSIYVTRLEGQMIPYVMADPMSPYPESDADKTDFVKTAVLKALDEKPKASLSESIDIDTDAFECDDKVIRDAFVYISGGIESAIEDSFDSAEVGYEEDFSESLTMPTLDPADIESFNLKYDYYRCPVCSNDTDERVDICEKCKTDEPQQLRYRDSYTIDFAVKEGSATFEDDFNYRTADELKAVVAEGNNGYYDVKDVSVVYNSPRIRAVVDRINNRISTLDFITDVEAKVSVVFTGQYAELGERTFTIDYVDHVRYSFSWVAIVFEQHAVTFEPDSTNDLLAKLYCDNPEKQTHRLISSDPSIATIDEKNNYVKTHKIPGTVIITAEFEYLGETYTDECVVTVGYAVEGVDITKRSLKLSVGDTFEQTVKVSPKKASVKTAHWFSEDETVATVSDDGVINAVGKGNTVVYCLTDDGYYKASCKVEVK